MNAVSSWLLGIACVVIMSVLAEFVLPEGQINKYIKVIFSFFILLAIIMPLPKLFGKDFNINDYFTSQPTLQKDYLEQLNLDKLTALQEDLSKDVSNKGFKNVLISINANIFSEKLEIYSIIVDLRELEYDNTIDNKDIVTTKLEIAKLIEQYSNLKNVEVIYYE